MNFVINTGNPQLDQQEISRYQQHYAAQGLVVYAQPNPGGGFLVTVAPAQGAAPAPQYGAPAQPAAPSPQQYGAPQGQYGAPAQQYGAPAASPQQYGAPAASPQQYGAPAAPAQQYGAPAASPQQYGAPAAPAQQYGAPAQQAAPQQYGGPPAQYGAPAGAPGAPNMAYAMAGGGAIADAAAADAAPPLSKQRVAYLRKVYGLLAVAAFLATGTGWAVLTLLPEVDMTSPDGHPARVPLLVSYLLAYPQLRFAAFGLLFVSTLGASAVSKVKGINVIALMFVATLMGAQLSPMIFEVQFYAGLGATLSTNPLRDAMVMVLSVFVGITGYVFVTRKDFSWLGSILSMGVMVVFAACILTFVFQTEVFSLAVASVGALLSVGLLLYVTSYIFRNSEMDDAVGDALALLVQLRNLFMFLLRILGSSRR